MELRDDLLRIVGTAEQAVAELAAKAMTRRAYVEAAVLLDVARQIHEIGQTTPLGPVAALPAPAEPVGARPVTNPARAAGSRKPKKADYPKFFRDGDTLIKVGWSKSEGSEYEHKCPKRVLDVLVAELPHITGPGKRFVMDKVLPLSDPDTGVEFATYQPYIALAFLRQAGLVEQHGRSGYSIPKPKTLTADADRAWGGVQSR
jgi:hypothetical protein